MIRAFLGVILMVAAGCSTAAGPASVPNLRDLAGAWHGRLAGPIGNAAASLAINDDGTYAGTMHFGGGDRPFTGTIVLTSHGRFRYLGTLGDGSLDVTPPHGPAAALRFVPDGGGGGGSFTRRR